MRRRDHRRARRRCRRCRGRRRRRRRGRHRRGRHRRDRHELVRHARDTTGGRACVRARDCGGRMETIVGESGQGRRAGKARLSRVVRL